MAWRSVEIQEQRIRFVVAASRGEHSLSQLCQEFEISRPTGRLWLERYRRWGVAGVAEQSRRPKSSPSRIAAGIEQRIVELRGERPDWGARKLAVLLEWEGLTVPPATVHRVLRRHQLVHPSDSHSQATGHFCREQPNQLWQMDFKSPKGFGTAVGPLSVLDDHSRYAVVLEHLPSGTGEHVQARLERAFGECGLPDAMLMDHGAPWWNMQSSGGWTRLSVWVMRLGIRLYFSGYRHPQTQGKVERFHRSLEMARRRRGLPEEPHRQAWLDRFREEYNHLRPHEALAMQTPSHFWHPSPRPYCGAPAEMEYAPGSEVHRLLSNGQLWLLGRAWQVAGALAGQRVRLERLDQRVLVYFANTLIRELDLAGQGSTTVEPCPANSLHLERMSGDIS
ncbi:MAG: IS481 family transposase [Acidimicrobiales bacterium]